MKYSKFDIQARFDQEAHLPRFKGSMLRGAMGHALKATICAVRVKECDPCILRPSCLYARIFEVKPDHEKKTGQVNFPHPYVLECLEDRTFFQKEKSLTFSLILFGGMIPYLPYFVYAFEQMGEQGIGRKTDGKRPTFSLLDVRHEGKVIYDQDHRTLPENLPSHQLCLGNGVTDQKVSGIRVNFETPLRVKNQGHYVREMDFVILVRSLLRRIKNLWQEFSETSFDVNEKELLQQAETIQTCNPKLFWEEQNRYSNRQKNRQILGGLKGSIEFQGNLAPFVPLFKIAQQVHIGKATSFGLGKLHYEIL